jgi:hypothetical protein
MDFVMFTGVKIVYESKMNDSQDKKDLIQGMTFRKEIYIDENFNATQAYFLLLFT